MMSSRRLIAMQPIGKTDSSISSAEAKNLRSVENYFLERDTRIDREKSTNDKIAQNFHYFSRLIVFTYIHINVMYTFASIVFHETMSICLLLYNVLNVSEIKS